jgi:undecaprenyl-diphosphatase
MTAGLALGLTRQAAARFSFLLAVPIIVLAGMLETWTLLREPVAVNWAALAAGVVVAALSAFACIHVFLRLVERVGMLPFVLYRLVLGIALLVFLA